MVTLALNPLQTTGLPGVVTTLVGQALRSGAMIHAGSNFSHVMAFRKAEGHTLVTDGIYRYGCYILSC